MMETNSHSDYTNLSIGQHSIVVGRNYFDITTPEGRMAVRAFAWTRAAEGDSKTKEALLAVVGRDDN